MTVGVEHLGLKVVSGLELLRETSHQVELVFVLNLFVNSLLVC